MLPPRPGGFDPAALLGLPKQVPSLLTPSQQAEGFHWGFNDLGSLTQPLLCSRVVAGGCRVLARPHPAPSAPSLPGRAEHSPAQHRAGFGCWEGAGSVHHPGPAPVCMSWSSGRMLSLLSLSSLPSLRQQKEETRLGAQVSVPLLAPRGNWQLQPHLLLEAVEPTRWQWDTAGSGRPGTGVTLSWTLLSVPWK